MLCETIAHDKKLHLHGPSFVKGLFKDGEMNFGPAALQALS